MVHLQYLSFPLRHIRPDQLNSGPMFFGPAFRGSVHPKGKARRTVSRFFAVLLALQILPVTGFALPDRLVLGLDGVAYRDMKALQAGVPVHQHLGDTGARFKRSVPARDTFRSAGLVSTFPSTSDVAWTDIFGDRPLPGYQRTYFSTAANSQIVHQRHLPPPWSTKAR